MADPALGEEVEQLRRSGVVDVVSPDDESLAAFGTDPLDPAVRPPAARSGEAQGRRSAGSLDALWRR
jgi:NTE family protein